MRVSDEEVLDRTIDDLAHDERSSIRLELAEIGLVRATLEEERLISTTATTVGMKRGGTLRFAGQIPGDIWSASMLTHPAMRPKERAAFLLARYPYLRFGAAPPPKVR